MMKRIAIGTLGILLGCAFLLGIPAGGEARSWDYERYEGTYDGPRGSDWYYDWYESPSTGRRAMPEGRMKSDRDLKRDVESELTWSPFVDADDIEVAVKDGTVTLKGTVEDQSSVEDAIENAYEAGAKSVVSRLQTREEE